MRYGLGCAPLGNLFAALPDEQAEATVEAAWDAGIRSFDTAPLYGHGLSEIRLGRALRGKRGFTISTKVGRLLVEGTDPDTIFVDVPPVRPVFDFSADGVRRSLEQSLERLGLDRVDTVLVHDPDDHADEALADAFPALRRLRDEGVVDRIGAGMNQAPMLARFVREAGIDCVLVAGRWSLLDRSAGDELLPLCAEQGVDVIVGGVFNSGLLADPRPGRTFDYAPASAELVTEAQRMRAVCESQGTSLRAAALQFPFTHEAVTAVVVGARSPAEIRSNVTDAHAALPENIWDELSPPARNPRR